MRGKTTGADRVLRAVSQRRPVRAAFDHAHFLEDIRGQHALGLKQALRASALIARTAQKEPGVQPEIAALGLEVLGVSIMNERPSPSPDMARALEAEARESNLQAAADVVYTRRMSAIEKERAIREIELDTDIAVEQKKRQISETKMVAKAALMRRDNELRADQVASDVDLEAHRKALVEGQTANSRTLGEAEAYRLGSVMQALDKVDPRLVQALVAVGMQPAQLIAQAFGGLAENVGRIAQLNASPDLLQTLMGTAARTEDDASRTGRERGR